MKHRDVRWAMSAACAALIVSSSALAQAPAAQPFRALFVGNSYTYFNALPVVIRDLAAAANQPRRFEPYVVLVGGSTLEAHLTRKTALDEIARGRWDAVVVQEQSTRPITDPRATQRDVKIFADAVAKVGAKLFVYETWAREVTPDMQDSLSRVLHTAAAMAGANVIHTGDAWRAFRAQERTVPAGEHSVLFQPDGSHPSPIGTYLAANVMYATFYEKSPVGLPGVTRATTAEPPAGPAPEASRASVDAALAKRIQELAWKAVRP